MWFELLIRQVISMTVAAALAPALIASVSDDPFLVIHGEPFATGQITLSVAASEAWEGAPVYLVLGFDALPLLAPVNTGKGPFWVGAITHVKPFGVMPVGGPLHVSATLPDVVPGAEGLHIAVQMMLPGRLTNAATVPLQAPYFLPSEATQIVADTPQFAAQFGDQHAVGDFNGDGELDIAVGAWFESGTSYREGRVHVRWGPELTASTTLGSPTPGVRHYFGFGLTAIDVDGDEVDDLVVSEGSGYPDQADDPGRLWIFRGASAFSTTPHQSIIAGVQGEEALTFGRMTSAGDFNNDGVIDLAAIVPDAHSPALSEAGRIDVFWGPLFDEFDSVVSPDPTAFGYFGSRIHSADFNGDGVADLVEASGRDDYGGVDNLGRLHLFSGPTLEPFKTIDNPLPSGFNSRFGNYLAAADLNGDGADEIVTTDQHGRAYIFWSPGFDSYHLLREPPAASPPNVSFGYFADVGDVNGDGFLDVAIGAPFAAGVGRVYVYLGPHFGTALVVEEQEPEVLAGFGWFLSLADLDGDGRCELISGSDTGDVEGLVNAGRLTVMGLGVGP